MDRSTPIRAVLSTLSLCYIYNHLCLQHKQESGPAPRLGAILSVARIPSESHQDRPNPLRIHWDISTSLRNRLYKDSLISHSFLNRFAWSCCHSGGNFTADTSTPICGTDHSFVHSADRTTSSYNFFLRLNPSWTLNLILPPTNVVVTLLIGDLWVSCLSGQLGHALSVQGWSFN